MKDKKEMPIPESKEVLRERIRAIADRATEFYKTEYIPAFAQNFMEELKQTEILQEMAGDEFEEKLEYLLVRFAIEVIDSFRGNWI